MFGCSMTDLWRVVEYAHMRRYESAPGKLYDGSHHDARIAEVTGTELRAECCEGCVRMGGEILPNVVRKRVGSEAH